MDCSTDPELESIAAEAKKLASAFGDEYWSQKDQAHEFPWEYYNAFAKGGWLGIVIPEEYGGAGLGSFEGVLFSEELAAADSGTASSLGGNILGLTPILIAGSSELKEDLLPQHTSGPNLASYFLTKPDAGSDVASMRSTDTLDGDEYVINGAKRFITNG